MKQIGNLAIVCSKRPDMIMKINDGKVLIAATEKPDCIIFSSEWHDDAKINDIIYQLNFGRYCMEKMQK